MTAEPLPQTDLSITKTDAVTSVSPNSPVTYVIVVSNNGTSPSRRPGSTINQALLSLDILSGFDLSLINSCGPGQWVGKKSAIRSRRLSTRSGCTV